MYFPVHAHHNNWDLDISASSLRWKETTRNWVIPGCGLKVVPSTMNILPRTNQFESLQVVPGSAHNLRLSVPSIRLPPSQQRSVLHSNNIWIICDYRPAGLCISYSVFYPWPFGELLSTAKQTTTPFGIFIQQDRNGNVQYVDLATTLPL